MKKHWQQIERQALPWQAKQKQAQPWQADQGHYNPATAIGGPPWTGATVAESSAPVYV